MDGWEGSSRSPRRASLEVRFTDSVRCSPCARRLEARLSASLLYARGLCDTFEDPAAADDTEAVTGMQALQRRQH